jgi:hypothetical protein
MAPSQLSYQANEWVEFLDKFFHANLCFLKINIYLSWAGRRPGVATLLWEGGPDYVPEGGMSPEASTCPSELEPSVTTPALWWADSWVYLTGSAQSTPLWGLASALFSLGAWMGGGGWRFLRSDIDRMTQS